MMHREIDSSLTFTTAPQGRDCSNLAHHPSPRPRVGPNAFARLCLLVPTLLVGCSATRTYSPPRPPVAMAATTIAPADEFEAAVLRRLDAIQGEGRVADASAEALVQPAYFAANGRRCRGLVFSGGQYPGSKARLACSAGGPWFYVPLLNAHSGSEALAQRTPSQDSTGARP